MNYDDEYLSFMFNHFDEKVIVSEEELSYDYHYNIKKEDILGYKKDRFLIDGYVLKPCHTLLSNAIVTEYEIANNTMKQEVNVVVENMFDKENNNFQADCFKLNNIGIVVKLKYEEYYNDQQMFDNENIEEYHFYYKIGTKYAIVPDKLLFFEVYLRLLRHKVGLKRYFLFNNCEVLPLLSNDLYRNLSLFEKTIENNYVFHRMNFFESLIFYQQYKLFKNEAFHPNYFYDFIQGNVDFERYYEYILQYRFTDKYLCSYQSEEYRYYDANTIKRGHDFYEDYEEAFLEFADGDMCDYESRKDRYLPSNDDFKAYYPHEIFKENKFSMLFNEDGQNKEVTKFNIFCCEYNGYRKITQEMVEESYERLLQEENNDHDEVLKLQMAHINYRIKKYFDNKNYKNKLLFRTLGDRIYFQKKRKFKDILSFEPKHTIKNNERSINRFILYKLFYNNKKYSYIEKDLCEKIEQMKLSYKTITNEMNQNHRKVRRISKEKMKKKNRKSQFKNPRNNFNFDDERNYREKKNFQTKKKRDYQKNPRNNHTFHEEKNKYQYNNIYSRHSLNSGYIYKNKTNNRNHKNTKDIYNPIFPDNVYYSMDELLKNTEDATIFKTFQDRKYKLIKIPNKKCGFSTRNFHVDKKNYGTVNFCIMIKQGMLVLKDRRIKKNIQFPLTVEDIIVHDKKKKSKGKQPAYDPNEIEEIEEYDESEFSRSPSSEYNIIEDIENSYDDVFDCIPSNDKEDIFTSYQEMEDDQYYDNSEEEQEKKELLKLLEEIKDDKYRVLGEDIYNIDIIIKEINNNSIISQLVDPKKLKNKYDSLLFVHEKRNKDIRLIESSKSYKILFARIMKKYSPEFCKFLLENLKDDKLLEQFLEYFAKTISISNKHAINASRRLNIPLLYNQENPEDEKTMKTQNAVLSINSLTSEIIPGWSPLDITIEGHQKKVKLGKRKKDTSEIDKRKQKRRKTKK